MWAGESWFCEETMGQQNENEQKVAGQTYPADTLGLEPDEMRRLGYRVVDLVVEHLCTKAQQPAIKTGSAPALRAQLGGPIPTEPANADAMIDLLTSIALTHQQNGDHPRYFARVPGPSSFAGVLGEWLGTGFNTMTSSWAGGSGATTIELVVTDWLRQLLGLPEGTEGVLSSGGSMANLTAFGAARAAYGQGIVYLTEQAHASLVRGLHELGFPKSDVRMLPSDANLRMPISALQTAILADLGNGRRPMMVIASAGTTNTGAVDPLHEMADLCRQHDIWFHIDGAYGAPAALCEQGRRFLSGIERADSLSVDPHKWLFQPYDVGCTLVTRPGALKNAYAMTPEYLKDVKAAEGEVDLRDRSLELTRRSRALKIWLTMRIYGTNRIRQAIERGIAMAEYTERLIAESKVWEIVTPAQIGIVTFALRGGDKPDHERAAKRLAETGFAAVTSTMLKDRSVLRLCTINPLTTQDDIRETLDRLKAAATSS
jgi:glutamate/tyrosine decarboxylase-like PLP-dependent enzyme